MRRMRWLIAASSLLVVACDEGPMDLPNLAVHTMEVDPATVELAVGDTVSVTAYPRAQDGVVLGSVGVEWTVDVPQRVSVTTQGYTIRITALEPGTVVVTATSEEKSADATLTVTPGAVASVTLDVDTIGLGEGARHSFTARAWDAWGNEVTGRAVVWRSSDPSVAQVDPAGRVTGIRPGSSHITARVDGDSAQAFVFVYNEHPYDLVYTAWSGESVPTLHFQDIRDSTYASLPLLPEGMHGGGAAASPDGGRIAFSGSSAAHGTGIFVMDRDGSDLVLIDTTITPICGSLAWSPDGLKLAYMCQPAGAGADLVTIDPDGANRRVLTDDVDDSHGWPSWSPQQPDGSYRIAYARIIAGEPRLWTMKSDGTDQRQLIDGYADQPAWSPNGATIVFQRSGAATFGDLYLVQADGTHVRSLLGHALAGPQHAPKWSPDGKLIAFASSHEGYGTGEAAMQIYTVEHDGNLLARRTRGEGERFAPAWVMR